MSNNFTNNTRDTNHNGQFIRAVEEAFFLLDRDRNRLINSDDFCAIAEAVGKNTTFYFYFKKIISSFFLFFLLIRYTIGF
jgi:Ca2+-binding EF-hand superfamily protein